MDNVDRDPAPAASPRAGEAETAGEGLALAPVIPDPIRDGSQVVAHDGYDVQVFEEARRAYPRMATLVGRAATRLVVAPALIRDLFFSFHQRTVVADPPVPLTPAHEANRRIVEQVIGTVAWAQVRAAGTVGDPLASALATIAVAERALAALDAATVAALNRLHALEAAAADLFARAEALTDLAAGAGADRAETLFAQAAEARRLAAERRAAADEAAAALAAGAEERDDAVRRVARRGLARAEAEVDALHAAVGAFGGGYGDGPGGGAAGGGLALADALALATHVGRSPRLRQLALLCGRFTRIALAVQRSRVRHPPDEVAAIGYGADLARLLASELSLLTDPDLEALFLLRFVERGLLQYDLVGNERQGRGPIVVALDESGSMAEPAGRGPTKEIWSKAVVLALLAIARKQRRDLALLHFAGHGELAEHRFPRGEGAWADVLAAMDHFFGGGTIYEPWLERALALVEEAPFDRADVICLSDGLTDLDPAVVARWNRVRAARGMRAYAVLIGAAEGAGLLATISDALLTLDDLAAEGEVLRTIFGI